MSHYDALRAVQEAVETPAPATPPVSPGGFMNRVEGFTEHVKEPALVRSRRGGRPGFSSEGSTFSGARGTTNTYGGVRNGVAQGGASASGFAGHRADGSFRVPVLEGLGNVRGRGYASVGIDGETRAQGAAAFMEAAGTADAKFNAGTRTGGSLDANLGGLVDANLRGDVLAGSSGHAASRGTFRNGRLDANAEATVFAGAKAEGSARFGSGPLTSEVTGYAMAGATASAHARSVVDPTRGQADVSLGVDAFAGARAGVSKRVNFAGIGHITAGIEKKAGIGITAQKHIGFKDGKLSFNVRLGAAFKAGVGKSLSGEIDVGGMARRFQDDMARMFSGKPRLDKLPPAIA